MNPTKRLWNWLKKLTLWQKLGSVWALLLIPGVILAESGRSELLVVLMICFLAVASCSAVFERPRRPKTPHARRRTDEGYLPPPEESEYKKKLRAFNDEEGWYKGNNG